MDASPISINFHVLNKCDSQCRFCFANFDESPQILPIHASIRILELLRAAGGEKITFAGGEPTLHPHIDRLILHAKRLGFITGIVTNGSRLRGVLRRVGAALDWVGLSVDSSCEATQRELGRGTGRHVARAVKLSHDCKEAGVLVKLNTVVTALTWQEDMSQFVRTIAPARWKVFQVLRVEGQNDGSVEPYLITARQFRAFMDRHAHLVAEGFPPVAEDNDAMIDSYVMIDPAGRFFGNTAGRHRASEPILSVGIVRALASVGYDHGKFEARGGHYAWTRSRPATRLARCAADAGGTVGIAG